MNKHLRVFLMVLAAVLSAMELYALDKAEVWNLYREGESSFRQANELLQTDPARARDLFQKAALCFETVRSEGGIENGRLFYNIGNIYFRLGDTGKAILNYRRAERFIPNDINLQQNLNYARSRRVDKIEPKPQTQVLRTLFFWHYDLGGMTRAWLLAAISGLLWISAGMYLAEEKLLAPLCRHLLCGAQPSSRVLPGSGSLRAVQRPLRGDSGKGSHRKKRRQHDL